MCVYSVHKSVPTEPRVSVRSLRTELQMVIKLPCGCWEPNPGSLQGQQELLGSEPSLLPSSTCNAVVMWLYSRLFHSAGSYRVHFLRGLRPPQSLRESDSHWEMSLATEIAEI